MTLRRFHYLHIKVGESRHEWYWKAIARSIFAFSEQRTWYNRECPKYFLLEFEERKNKHSIQPNGRYDKDVLREEEPGFQYRDQQFKDYERTVKFFLQKKSPNSNTGTKERKNKHSI